MLWEASSGMLISFSRLSRVAHSLLRYSNFTKRGRETLSGANCGCNLSLAQLFCPGDWAPFVVWDIQSLLSFSSTLVKERAFMVDKLLLTCESICQGERSEGRSMLRRMNQELMHLTHVGTMSELTKELNWNAENKHLIRLLPFSRFSTWIPMEIIVISRRNERQWHSPFTQFWSVRWSFFFFLCNVHLQLHLSFWCIFLLHFWPHLLLRTCMVRCLAHPKPIRFLPFLFFQSGTIKTLIIIIVVLHMCWCHGWANLFTRPVSAISKQYRLCLCKKKLFPVASSP